jgi:sulfite oxidase
MSPVPPNVTDIDPRLQIHSSEPLVGGPPLPLLRRHYVTPTELFYVRNHAPVPQIDPASFALEISGLVHDPLRLSVSELVERFTRDSVTATVMCAGNRRSELMKVAPTPGEVPWGADGIGTAEWSGVRLRDVLEAAGLGDDAAHIAFAGIDQVTRHGETFGYGGSIPRDKALGAEVLIADRMNGAPLTPVHGFPLRVVVPGYIGARSVKWLARIHAQSDPSSNYFQAKAYRLFAPHETAESVRWEDGIPLGENSINAVICSPEPGAVVPPGAVTVQGFAIAGGDRRIARVDVSPDGGRTWVMAKLEDSRRWSWSFWEARFDLRRGPAELVARAWDTAANTQPERLESVWNFKNNAWHRVPLDVS